MTQTCVSCGAQSLVAFGHRDFWIEHGAARKKVDDLSGVECGECGEIIFDDRSTTLYAEASDALVLAERQSIGEELRLIRSKLNLTQQEAAAITGGGHNAFSRYERGEAAPLLAVINLMRLLNRHPDLLGEILPRKQTNVTPLRKAQTGEREAARKIGPVGQKLAANALATAQDFTDGNPTIAYQLADPATGKRSHIEIRRRSGRMQARWIKGEKLKVRTHRAPERFTPLLTNQQWSNFDAGGDTIDDKALSASFRFILDADQDGDSGNSD